MRLLVCGGRDYHDGDAAWNALDGLGPDLVICGGCHGADYLAKDWCDARGVPCMVFPAPWQKHGPKAGPVRNRWMIELGQPTQVLAFPGGSGTANMVLLARTAGIPVTEVGA